MRDKKQVSVAQHYLKNLCTNCRTDEFRGARRIETGFPAPGDQVRDEDFEHRTTMNLSRADV